MFLRYVTPQNFPYQGFAESFFEASTYIEKLETKQKIWGQCAMAL